MSAKHTPGPWEWVGRDLEQKGGEYKTVIGSEVSCGAFCYGGSVDMTVSESDARLIAAAPDLLAALRDLMGDHGGSIGVSRTDGRALAALAAIAKATNEG
jgi:hypothetical protein